MPRKAKELSALEVGRLSKPGLHFVGGVAGLALQVQPSGARSWLLRMSLAGKRREMGLGGFPDVTLADARRRAREEREKADNGVDPIAARRAAAALLRSELAKALTFKSAALAYVEAHEPAWRNAKHAEQWRNTLASTYSLIGSVQVRDVELPHVLAVLEPIWRSKTETASRLRGRIESVLDWATARGYREGLNPARWKGRLDLLPSPQQDREGWPSRSRPCCCSRILHARATGSARRRRSCAGICDPTAARSGEVRSTTWSELDLDARTWTIPGERMKAGKAHRVPLSEAALRLLRDQPRMAGNDLVFSAPRGGRLSDMTLVAVTRRMGVAAVPHGFRSTFRDWCSERTNYPRDVAEMALAQRQSKHGSKLLTVEATCSTSARR